MFYDEEILKKERPDIKDRDLFLIFRNDMKSRKMSKVNDESFRKMKKIKVAILKEVIMKIKESSKSGDYFSKMKTLQRKNGREDVRRMKAYDKRNYKR